MSASLLGKHSLGFTETTSGKAQALQLLPEAVMNDFPPSEEITVGTELLTPIQR